MVKKDQNKILFMDLDGTFLSNPNLNSYTSTDLKTLEEFQKKNYLVITTGRSFSQASFVWDKICDNSSKYGKYFISSNGSVIAKDGIKIRELSIEVDEVKKLISYFRKKDVKLGIKLSDEDLFYSNSSFKYIASWLSNVESKPMNQLKLTKKNYSKLGIYLFSSKGNNRIFYEDVKKEIGKDFNVSLTGKGYYLEITNKNASKETAAKWLMKELNLDHKNSIAVGDSGNDLEIMKFVTTPILMKKTPEYIINEIYNLNKNLIVTTTPRTNGITQALNKIK